MLACAACRERFGRCRAADYATSDRTCSVPAGRTLISPSRGTGACEGLCVGRRGKRRTGTFFATLCAAALPGGRSPQLSRTFGFAIRDLHIPPSTLRAAGAAAVARRSSRLAGRLPLAHARAASAGASPGLQPNLRAPPATSQRKPAPPAAQSPPSRLCTFAAAPQLGPGRTATGRQPQSRESPAQGCPTRGHRVHPPPAAPHAHPSLPAAAGGRGQRRTDRAP